MKIFELLEKEQKTILIGLAGALITNFFVFEYPFSFNANLGALTLFAVAFSFLIKAFLEFKWSILSKVQQNVKENPFSSILIIILAIILISPYTDMFSFSDAWSNLFNITKVTTGNFGVGSIFSLLATILGALSGSPILFILFLGTLVVFVGIPIFSTLSFISGNIQGLLILGVLLFVFYMALKK